MTKRGNGIIYIGVEEPNVDFIAIKHKSKIKNTMKILRHLNGVIDVWEVDMVSVGKRWVDIVVEVHVENLEQVNELCNIIAKIKDVVKYDKSIDIEVRPK